MCQDNQHWGIHLVIALEPTLLHCIAWLVSELLNTPVNQPSHSRVCDWSGLCKYNVLLRWLDTVFQGQYLPSLSINYIAINKVLEKLPPQLYQIKMKICYDQGCNGIGVVIATRSRELFPPIAASMFMKFKRNP